MVFQPEVLQQRARHARALRSVDASVLCTAAIWALDNAVFTGFEMLVDLFLRAFEWALHVVLNVFTSVLVRAVLVGATEVRAFDLWRRPAEH